MKGAILTAVFLLVICRLTFAQSGLKGAIREFTRLRNELEGASKKSDLLFLLDTSGSLSFYHFESEKKFVLNFLSTITVSLNAARIEVIPFGSTTSRYIDGVSNPSLEKHKCDLVEKFYQLKHLVHGHGTNTKAAFELAYDVCLGKYSANKRNQVKTVVILITDGNWNVPWQDPSPVPVAKRLHVANVEVFAIGVGPIVDPYNLQKVVKDPVNQAFHLISFAQFNELSLYLRGDPFGTELQLVDSIKCNNVCDPIAKCACHLVYAYYNCLCPEGFTGSGLAGQCHRLQGKKRK